MTDGADALDAAWHALRDDWTNTERHRAFVALAHALDRLGDAGARYRDAASDPARAEQAEKGRQLVIGRAVAQLDALPRTSRESALRRGRRMIPFALLGLIMALSFVAAGASHQHALAEPPALALEIVIVALLPWRRMLGE